MLIDGIGDEYEQYNYIEHGFAEVLSHDGGYPFACDHSNARTGLLNAARNGSM